MDKTYKAEPYKITTHHQAVVNKAEPWENVPAYDTFEKYSTAIS